MKTGLWKKLAIASVATSAVLVFVVVASLAGIFGAIVSILWVGLPKVPMVDYADNVYSVAVFERGSVSEASGTQKADTLLSDVTTYARNAKFLNSIALDPAFALNVSMKAVGTSLLIEKFDPQAFSSRLGDGATMTGTSTDGTVEAPFSGIFTTFASDLSGRAWFEHSSDKLNYQRSEALPVEAVMFRYRKNSVGTKYDSVLEMGIAVRGSWAVAERFDGRFASMALAGKEVSLFSGGGSRAMLESMTVRKGESSITVPRQDRFEGGMKFYLKWKLAGKEREFEAVYGKYLSERTVVFGGDTYVSDYVLKFPGFDDGNATGWFDRLSPMERAYARLMEPEWFEGGFLSTDEFVPDVLSTGLSFMERYFEYEALPDGRIFVKVSPLLYLQSVARTFRDSWLNFSSEGFGTAENGFKPLGYLRELWKETLVAAITAYDEDVSGNSWGSQWKKKALEDFDKNLHLVIAGIGNGDEWMPIFHSIPLPRNHAFFGLSDKGAAADIPTSPVRVRNLIGYEKKASDARAVSDRRTEGGLSGRPFSELVAEGIAKIKDAGFMVRQYLKGPGNFSNSDYSFELFRYGRETFSCEGSLSELADEAASLAPEVGRVLSNPDALRITSVLDENGIRFGASSWSVIEFDAEIARMESVREAAVARANAAETPEAKASELAVVESVSAKISELKEAKSLAVDSTADSVSLAVARMRKSLSETEEKIRAMESNPDMAGPVAELKAVASRKRSDAELVESLLTEYREELERTFSIIAKYQRYEDVLDRATMLENCVIGASEGRISSWALADAEKMSLARKIVAEQYLEVAWEPFDAGSGSVSVNPSELAGNVAYGKWNFDFYVSISSGTVSETETKFADVETPGSISVRVRKVVRTWTWNVADEKESREAEISKKAAVLAAKWSWLSAEAGLLEASWKLTKEQADAVRSAADAKYAQLIRISADFDPNSETSIAWKTVASTEMGRKISKLIADGDFRSYVLRRDPYTGGTLSNVFEFVKLSISGFWSEGGDADLVGTYNLMAFYAGIADAKRAFSNNFEVVTWTPVPFARLEGFGAFGRFAFPAAVDGKFSVSGLEGFGIPTPASGPDFDALYEAIARAVLSSDYLPLFSEGGPYDVRSSTGAEAVGPIASKCSGERISELLGDRKPEYFSEAELRAVEAASGSGGVSAVRARVAETGGFRSEEVASMTGAEAVAAKSAGIREFDAVLSSGLSKCHKLESYSAAKSKRIPEFEQPDAVKVAIAALESATSSAFAGFSWNASKRGFNAKLEELRSEKCPRVIDPADRDACDAFYRGLIGKPDVKSFLEELEYADSTKELTEMYGWRFPKTSEWKGGVRPARAPYDTNNGGLVGQCVWYIQVRKDAKGGNARQWSSQGTVVKPEGDFLRKISPGDVVVFEEGDYGHIAVVEWKDDAKNLVGISESNYGTQGVITRRTIRADSLNVMHYLIGMRDKYSSVE